MKTLNIVLKVGVSNSGDKFDQSILYACMEIPQ
jgi:hypothetical protein